MVAQSRHKLAPSYKIIKYRKRQYSGRDRKNVVYTESAKLFDNRYGAIQAGCANTEETLNETGRASHAQGRFGRHVQLASIDERGAVNTLALALEAIDVTQVRKRQIITGYRTADQKEKWVCIIYTDFIKMLSTFELPQK